MKEKQTQFDSLDRGTAELSVQSGRVVFASRSVPQGIAQVLEEHWLDRLVLTDVISAALRDAAMRFRSDYYEAGLMHRMGGSYSPVRGSFSYYGGWDERSDAEEEAYARYRHVMRFLKGDLADIVVSVVCYDQIPAPHRLRTLVVGLKVLQTLYTTGARQPANR